MPRSPHHLGHLIVDMCPLLSLDWATCLALRLFSGVWSFASHFILYFVSPNSFLPNHLIFLTMFPAYFPASKTIFLLISFLPSNSFPPKMNLALKIKIGKLFWQTLHIFKDSVIHPFPFDQPLLFLLPLATNCSYLYDFFWLHCLCFFWIPKIKYHISLSWIILLE